jgi:hypothetical protein
MVSSQFDVVILNAVKNPRISFPHA